MHRRRTLVPAAAALALLCTGPALTAVAVDTPRAAPPAGTADSAIVVVYAPGTAARDRAAARGGTGATRLRGLGRPRFELVRASAGSTTETLEALRSDPRVLTAVADQTFAVASAPDDPRFPEQWGLRNVGQEVNGTTGTAGADIDALLAWDRTAGSPSVVVADLDSGYRFDHPDLAGVAWTNPGEVAGNGVDDDANGYVDDTRGWDAWDHDNDPTDPALFIPYPGIPGSPVDSHGLHTAGTIAAQGDNGVGVTGVAQDVRLMPVRVCENRSCSLSTILEGINYAGTMGARAANISITGFFTDPSIVLTLTTAFAANPETLYVAAAGNNGADTDTGGALALPCAANPAKSNATIGYRAAKGAVDNVLCVAATDQSDGLAPFSTFGALSVDLGAPGVNVLSTNFLQDRGVYDEQFGGDGFDAWTTPVPPASAADQGFTRYILGGGSGAIFSDPMPSLNLPGTQVAGTTRATLSPAIALSSDYQECTLSFVAGARLAGDDAFTWTLSLDGTTVVDEPVADVNPTSGRNGATFAIPPGPDDHELRVGFQFYRGLAGDPAPWSGARALRLDCIGSNYRFDSGTSMATPHVTGAAALLFSLRPSASVSEVRKALLKGVEPLASLSTKTVTGGRLNAWRAMDALLPLDTRITSGPSGTVRATTATFAFDTNGTGGATGYECRLDSGPLVPCSNPVTYTGLKPGKHLFRVRSVLPGGVDNTPAVREWTVLR